MQDVFEIKTVNHTYGEVYVNALLDRESVDRYLLRVGFSFLTYRPGPGRVRKHVLPCGKKINC